jgi:dTDP-4-amino-4,6-dideoxygalactose transaminase
LAILLAVGDCFAAFLLAPVLAGLRARGAACRLAFAAGGRELAGLRELLGEPDAAGEGAAALAAAADGVRTVAVAGRRPAIAAVADAARAAGRRVVWLDSAVQAFPGRLGPGPAPAAGDEHCVAGADEARVLQAAGAASAVHEVGDLLADALAGHGPSANSDGSLWLALERVDAVPPPVVAALRQAIAATGLIARTNAADLDLGAERVARTPTAELAAARRARAIVTDSVGQQRLAMALGIPCVALPGCDLLLAGVATGRLWQPRPGEPLDDVLRRAAATPRGAAAPPSGAAARLVDVLLGAAATAPPPLPSDQDASGRTFGSEEAALVIAALQRGTLHSTRGTFVATFERRFAHWLGTRHAIACASGTAAMHAAIAALRLQPGDEVVTTPITDMGAITPILYEGGVPVFADVDPTTLNVTRATIERALTDRTRAIVATHLFGMPCELPSILSLARERGIPVLEDAAQAFGATLDGRKVGAFGALGAFSLQQGKHITTGEGGIVATDDDELARRVFLFVNKAWGYGDPQPDHYFPALNYRLGELQGAVATAQLPKLDGVVAARRAAAGALRRRLAAVPGLLLPADPEHGTHAFWRFAFQVDPAVVPGGAAALGRRMQAAGIACAPRYIQKPAFACALFADWRASPATWLPLQHNPRRDRPQAMFDRADFPGVERGLERVIVLPLNERYTDAHVAHVAAVIAAAVAELRHG